MLLYSPRRHLYPRFSAHVELEIKKIVNIMRKSVLGGCLLHYLLHKRMNMQLKSRERGGSGVCKRRWFENLAGAIG